MNEGYATDGVEDLGNGRVHTLASTGSQNHGSPGAHVNAP